MKNGYDFSGWVTKNDIVCTDGVTIKQGAFAGNEGQQVPLVWNHNYNSNDNVLGHMILHNAEQGVYGYGYLNDTESAQNAKAQLSHGDLNSMSIGAKNIKRMQPGNRVVHGNIYEVSLVMAPANAGALIDHVVTHGDEEDGERAIVYPGNRILMSEDLLGEDLLTHNEGDPKVATNQAGQVDPQNDNNVEDILDTLNPEQQAAVADIIGAVFEASGIDPETGEPVAEPAPATPATPAEPEEPAITQSANLEGGTSLKHNAFANNQAGTQYVGAASGTVPAFIAGDGEAITHADMNTIISAAAKGYVPSLSAVVQDTLKQSGVQESDDVLKHAITNIDVLFPNTKTIDPIKVYNPQGQNVDKIMSGFFKSPISRIKNVILDLSEDEARARGYIKGNEKLESIESVYFRETTPGTVMRKEQFDRDDIVDIAENGVDVVQFVQANQKVKLAEEIVRAAFIGDGRDITLTDGSRNPLKISENHIRPIVKDDPLYTIPLTIPAWKDVIDQVTFALASYDGSGSPTLFINPFDLAGIKTLKDTTGRFLFGASNISNAVPTDANIAAYFGCTNVLTYRRMPRGSFVIGNLVDYAFGSAKGGEITNFDFFDIDFNRMKYLTETRLSGAIQTPKSFIFGKVTNPEKFGDITFTEAQGTAMEKFDATGLKSVPSWLTESEPVDVKPTTTTTTTSKP